MGGTKRRAARWFGVVLMLPLAAPGGGVVTECTEAALRAAMAGGGTVTFACDGTIALAGTISNTLDTVLDASGHSVMLSGGGQRRVFYVATNTSLTLVNLTVANGAATSGAGVFNDGGRLILLSSRFETNQAGGSYGFEANCAGGAVYNQDGVVNATNCLFSGNSAKVAGSSMGQPVFVARGGAIMNLSGSITLESCILVGNRSQGYSMPFPQSGSAGSGGAIENSGALTVFRCTFMHNTAEGGHGSYTLGGVYNVTSGMPGESGSGGALRSTGPAFVDASTFLSNRVIGGNGGHGSFGWTPPMSAGWNGGSGGSGGSGTGGAIFGNSFGVVVNSTFTGNSAVGGQGGRGGGGGSSTRSGLPGGNGGAGGNSGDAFAAVCGGVRLTNCTLAFNSGYATNGGAGGGGGGGQSSPDGLPGPNGADGRGCGGLAEGSCVNTVLASNSPGGNCYTVVDGGYNVSSDSNCLFSATGSRNNLDPKLGPLAANGGPTPTMALLPGSPAIDAANDAVAPATDQRGVPRPVGAHADIGAFEFTALLEVSAGPGNSLNILVCGPAGQSCRLLASATFDNWQPIATNQIRPNGSLLFQQTYDPGAAPRFYRASLP